MASELGPEDLALLERVAARVIELGMEVPALLTLESGRPLSLLAGQAMVFFEPFVQALFRMPDYRRFAALIERRDTVETLIGMIERRAEAADAGRREQRRRRKAARAADHGRPA
ncbi:MAG TPA: hypothetical protein VFK69_04430, partial [Candidatus Eisenbacteria bacterium]|nr:hypothetical protein [Candidatus Eisenbacteria bacterium]